MTDPKIDQLRGYDFMMCMKCHRVLTRLQMIDGLDHQQGHACPFGSLHYHPTNAPAPLLQGASVWAFLGWWLRCLVRPADWPIAKFTALRLVGRA